MTWIEYPYGLYSPLTVCLVLGSLGWSHFNPRFGDGSNPCFVWLREWIGTVLCLVGGMSWGGIHPIFCLDGWIRTEPGYGHLCTEMVRLPSSMYDNSHKYKQHTDQVMTHGNFITNSKHLSNQHIICAQHIAIFSMLAPCIKEQRNK